MLSYRVHRFLCGASSRTIIHGWLSIGQNWWYREHFWNQEWINYHFTEWFICSSTTLSINLEWIAFRIVWQTCRFGRRIVSSGELVDWRNEYYSLGRSNTSWLCCLLVMRPSTLENETDVQMAGKMSSLVHLVWENRWCTHSTESNGNVCRQKNRARDIGLPYNRSTRTPVTYCASTPVLLRYIASDGEKRHRLCSTFYLSLFFFFPRIFVLFESKNWHVMNSVFHLFLFFQHNFDSWIRYYFQRWHHRFHRSFYLRRKQIHLVFPYRFPRFWF